MLRADAVRQMLEIWMSVLQTGRLVVVLRMMGRVQDMWLEVRELRLAMEHAMVRCLTAIDSTKERDE